MGFLTRETPGLDLLVQGYICSHEELLLEKGNDRALQLILKYGLMTPALQESVEKVQQRMQEENLLFSANTKQIKKDFEQNFRPAEGRHRSALEGLKMEAQSLQVIEDLERRLLEKNAQIKRLQGSPCPDLLGLEQALKSRDALLSEIRGKERQAKEAVQSYSQELERLKEWRLYRDLDIAALEQQIREAAAALERANGPAKGILSAIGALSRQNKQKNRLKELEEKLAAKKRVDGYNIDPDQGERRLQELSKKTLKEEEGNLGLAALRMELWLRKQKIQIIEAEKLAYQNLLQLQGEKKALLETIRGMTSLSQQLFSLGSAESRRRLDARRREIDRIFSETKGDLEGQQRRALESEEQRHRASLSALVSSLHVSV